MKPLLAPDDLAENSFPKAHRWSMVVNAAVVAAVAALVVVAAVVSGTIDSYRLTLLFMGFDEDRAQLITSLLVATTAAAAATLVTNKNRQATLSGLASFAALFGYTFLRETRGALQSTGADGSFDLSGWLSTLVALLMAGLISSWSGATLAQALRPGLVGAGSTVLGAVRRRRSDRELVRGPLKVAVVLTLLVFTAPIFGDMVNYTPDSRMPHGGAPPVGLIPMEPTQSPTVPVPMEQTASPTLASNPPPPGPPTTSPAPTPTRSLPSNERPWLAWRPSGTGSVVTVDLPAPWRDGSATTENVGIYTPPGYDPHGNRRYPVAYEAPFDYSLWDSSVNIRVALDAMIDRGAVPAIIVVFINAWRAPIYDTECADSVDGRQWFDAFISRTVVSYVDSKYRTIARADARAFMGFSEGGYCAAILPLRHPTVFGTAIPISGYFRAGVGDASAKLPFGGDKAALAAASPMVVATELPAAERSTLFFIVVAKPGEPFFGTEAVAFEQLLATEGYRYVALDARVGHGWDQVRQELPVALEAWARQLVTVGAF